MTDAPLTATVIGYGNVGRPLARALTQAGARVVTVGEHEDSEHVRSAQLDGFQVFPAGMVRVDVDLVVLSVGDGEVAGVAYELAGNLETERKRDPEAPFGRTNDGSARSAPVVMHTSGRLGLAPLQHVADLGCPRMAWHPMQTFPQDAEPDRFHDISVGVTADPDAMPMAHRLADLLGAHVINVPEDARARYHLASVLASNFLPMLLEMGAQRFVGIVDSLEDAWYALMPLVKGMVESMDQYGPAGAMTGPVMRGDLEAVLEHLKTLTSPDEAELYRSMTRALVSLAMRSGRMDREQALKWLVSLEPQSKVN